MKKKQRKEDPKRIYEYVKHQDLTICLLWIVNQEYRKTKCIYVEWRCQWRWRNEMNTKISFSGCLQNAAVKSNPIKLHRRDYILPQTKWKMLNRKITVAISWYRAKHLNFFRLSHLYFFEKIFAQNRN